MDGLHILIASLTFVFLILVVGMNVINTLEVPYHNDGFVDIQKVSSIEIQIRKVLDKMDSADLCPLYQTIRSNMAKNEKTGKDITDQEVNSRVEASLALKIPGGALPCPLLRYPKKGSTDLDWLDFLQKVPSDFGARVVLMAIYAEGFLADKEQILKDALSGKGTVPVSDGFTVCSPDLATSRRAEKTKKESACVLPENLTPEQIQEEVTSLLKTLVSKKNTILKEKKIDPTIDIAPLIVKSNASAKYINVKSEQAKSGELEMDAPIPGK